MENNGDKIIISAQKEDMKSSSSIKCSMNDGKVNVETKNIIDIEVTSGNEVGIKNPDSRQTENTLVEDNLYKKKFLVIIKDWQELLIFGITSIPRIFSFIKIHIVPEVWADRIFYSGLGLLLLLLYRKIINRRNK